MSASNPAFERLTFVFNPSGPCRPEWVIWGDDAWNYADADALKTVQVAKTGARLAQMLNQIWPDGGTAK